MIVFVTETLVPFVFAIALVLFIYGVFNYAIIGAGDEERRQIGREKMIWGVLGFVLSLAIFGLFTFFAELSNRSSDVDIIKSERVQPIPNAPLDQS